MERERILRIIELLTSEYQKHVTEAETNQENLAQLARQLNLPDPEPNETMLASNYPAYFQAKRKLSDGLNFLQTLKTKINDAKALYISPSALAANSLVKIVTPAVPPKYPSGLTRTHGAILSFCGLGLIVLGLHLLFRSVPKLDSE